MGTWLGVGKIALGADLQVELKFKMFACAYEKKLAERHGWMSAGGGEEVLVLHWERRFLASTGKPQRRGCALVGERTVF